MSTWTWLKFVWKEYGGGGSFVVGYFDGSGSSHLFRTGVFILFIIANVKYQRQKQEEKQGHACLRVKGNAWSSVFRIVRSVAL